MKKMSSLRTSLPQIIRGTASGLLTILHPCVKHISSLRMQEWNGILGKVAVVFLLFIFKFQFSAFNSAFAQDAFYIYRNDGDFDGFFFDQVQRIGYSKTDLEGVEHDVYVVQEVQTPDSLYRIPLAAIDSVGFQQPDVIISEHFVNLEDYWTDDDFPYPYSSYSMTADAPYTLHWQSGYNWNTYTYGDVPHVGDVLYSADWIKPTWNDDTYEWEGGIDGPFIGKVREVREDPNEESGTGHWLIVCAPIEDIGDIIEQYIGVEDVGIDSDGNVRRRVAGLNKLKQRRRIEGNHGLTLININQPISIPLSEDGDFSLTVGADLNLSMGMQAVYNIGLKRGIYTKITLTRSLECGFSLSAKGTLKDDITKDVFPYVRVPFPAVLPVFEVRPAPGGFMRVAAELALSIKTPVSGMKSTETITIDTQRDFWHIVTANSNSTPVFPDDEDNDWSLEMAISGLVHAGVWVPVKLYTNSWAEKVASISVGSDVFIGPKFSGNLGLNLFANIGNPKNSYGMLRGSSFDITPLCIFPKTSAEVSVGTKSKKFDLIDGPEIDFHKFTLKLFPDFDGFPFELESEDSRFGYTCTRVVADVKPRQYCLPVYLGIAIYEEGNREESIEVVWDDSKGNQNLYSFLYTWDKATYTTHAYDGKYLIVPVLECMKNLVPAWDYAKSISCALHSKADHDDNKDHWISRASDTTDGVVESEFVVSDLMEGDEVVSVTDRLGRGVQILEEYDRESEPSFIHNRRYKYRFNVTKGLGSFLLDVTVHHKRSGTTEDLTIIRDF